MASVLVADLQAVADASLVEPDYVVDCSNVCMDLAGSAPSLRPLLSVARAAADHAGRRSSVLFVADQSIRRWLPKDDTRQLTSLVNAQYLLERPYADPVILGIADDSPSTRIISRDKFRDHRSDFPWLNTGDFRRVNWRIRDGSVVLYDEPLEPIEEFTAEKYAEQNEEARRAAFERLFSCTARGCRLQRHSHINQIPRRRDRGRWLCPACGQRLTDVGRRRQTIGLRLTTLADDRVLRLAPQVDDRLVIGRNWLPEDWRHGRVTRVSRQHLAVTCTEDDHGLPEAWVSDLGSTNGSVLVRRNGTTEVVGAEPIRLRPRERVVLADALDVALSGRTFSAGVGATALVARPTTSTTHGWDE